MSAPRDDQVYLHHIRDAIARIQTYVEGLTQADFLDTPIVQDAVIHQIQVIGEAARRVSASFQAKSPAVPWRNIVGMRHKLVHDYMSVDLEAVWTTVQKDIPALRAELSKLI